MKVTFVTGNPVKLHGARQAANMYDIEVDQADLDIIEIQSHEAEKIAQHKAEQAFSELQRPLFVSDDSWIIPGLRGFPGPYMRYTNEWLTPEDWLRLTTSLKDRKIILRQVVVYMTGDVQKTFSRDIEGELLSDIRGSSPYSHITLTSFDGGKRSGAEYIAAGDSYLGDRQTAWHDFFAWLAGD